MPKQPFACGECRLILETQEGNLGYCLKSDENVRAKTKKALREMGHKDADIQKVTPAPAQCMRCPSAPLTTDWQGFTIILDPSRSEVAKRLGIERAGQYALKVNIR